MKKEKILCNIENLNDIEKYKKIGINNFLFAVNEFSIGYKSFDLDEIVNFDCNKYLLLNRILDCKDVDSLKSSVNKLKSFDGIIFEDIAVYNILKDQNINLIYNQNHFATNYKSINYYLDILYSVVLSNELCFDEVQEIINKVNKPVVLNVFGKNPTMYSRRKLITNFNKYFNLDSCNDVILNDTITKNEFMAKESEYGTILFNNTYFNIINFVNKMNDNNILFYLIYPNSLNFFDIEKVIDGNYDGLFDDGFMNKKTIYKLGDKND